MSDITFWSWAAWIAVGLAIGAMAGRVLGGRRVLVIDLLISMAGACLGGWGSYLAIGDNTPQLFIISVLVALFAAGALLWLFNAIWQMFNKD